MNKGLLRGAPGPLQTDPVPARVTPASAVGATYRRPSFQGDYNRRNGVYLPTTCARPLQQFKDALSAARGSATVARILCLGDSLVYGSNASSFITKSWPAQLQTMLASRWGVTCTSGLVLADSTDTRWSGASGFTIVAGKWKSTVPGSTVTFTSVEAGDRLLIAYVPDGTGVFTYAIDGGAAVTVTISSSVPTATRWIQVTGLANTTHTVVFTHSSGNFVWLMGCGVERSGGVSITRYGNPGQSSVGLDNSNGFSNGPSTGSFLRSVDDGGPKFDLMLLAYGTNDASFQQYQPDATYAYYNAATTTAQAHLMDLVYIDPIPNGTYNIPPGWRQADTAAAIFDSADLKGVPVLALGEMWTYTAENANGLYHTDHTHLTDSGYARYASDVALALTSMVA